MLLLLPRLAPAAEPTPDPTPDPTGALLLRGTTPGEFVAAPRLGTDIDAVVSGPTVRTRVTQRFRNPTDGWVEAVYVHPLPENGAVDTLRMVVGQRIILGEIDAREQARQTYERAREAGQAASLLEQERPNVFTTSVANIGPGETVVVQLEYQAAVRQTASGSALRIPLVVAPRYNPPGDARLASLAPTRATDPVPDRARIEPPVLDPSQPREGLDNPVTLTVTLRAGFPLGAVTSAYHRIDIAAPAADTRVIRLAGPVPADRDFELRWQPAAGAAPAVGLFHERIGGEDYILASVTPPPAEAGTVAPPREVVFVIDNSGSMGGTSMEQAKAGLRFALDRLTARDRFNVIRFDDSMDSLFAAPVPADARNLERARAFVGALRASGGTEMLPPLRAALADANPEAPGLRQVVFLTDGAVGNERQLFDTIATRRGRSRLFMVGIGSAPNSFLMSRAAELGRGTYTQIGDVAEVAERMRELAGKLESPVLTGISAAFSAGQADQAPELLPDLYRGEPLVLVARVAALDGSVTLRGSAAGQPWSVTLPLAAAAPGQGLSKLWARRRITDAEVAARLGALTQDQADKRILELALGHGLVTRLTSLVAVDRTPQRPAGLPLSRAEVPLVLPAGWVFESVFGAPATAPLPGFDGVRKAEHAVAADPAIGTERSGIGLPQTATDAELRLLAGALLCGLSLLLFGLQRRRAAR